MATNVTINAPLRVDMVWASLVAFCDGKALRLQRQELEDSYLAWVSDGPAVYVSKAYKADSEPKGWDTQQKAANAADLAAMLAHEANLLDTSATRQELVVGERGSRMDGCCTPLVEQGWVRADFPLTKPSHIAFAHAKSFKALPGDYGKTVVLIPSSRVILVAGASAGMLSFDAPDSGVAGAYNICNHVEFWSSDQADATLLESIEIDSVSDETITLKRATTVPLPANAQAVPIVKSYTPLRGPEGIDGGARFLGSQTEKLGNPGEASEAAGVGASIGIRFFAQTSRATADASALAITAMLRDVL